MDPAADAHPPRPVHPDDAASLGAEARLTEVASGATSTVREWLERMSQSESRPVDECREALMNAIARGDLVVHAAG